MCRWCYNDPKEDMDFRHFLDLSATNNLKIHCSGSFTFDFGHLLTLPKYLDLCLDFWTWDRVYLYCGKFSLKLNLPSKSIFKKAKIVFKKAEMNLPTKSIFKKQTETKQAWLALVLSSKDFHMTFAFELWLSEDHFWTVSHPHSPP